MRKQIFTAPALKNVQHSADLFVMNSCDVYGRLKSQIFSPFDDKIVKQWLKSTTIDSENSMSILEFCFEAQIIGEEREKIVAVYETIREQKILGIRHEELGDIAEDLSMSAPELLSVLMQLRQHSLVSIDTCEAGGEVQDAN